MRPLAMTACALALCTASVSWPHHGMAQTLSAVESEEHGPYLAGPEGRPVYAFLTSVEIGGDGQDPLESCNEGECRQNWPLVTVDGEVSVGDGVDAELAETMQVDGETVLLYADHPLFHFFRDMPGAPPQGQGIYSYGGYWALLTPSGQIIRTGPMDDIDDYPLMPEE